MSTTHLVQADTYRSLKLIFLSIYLSDIITYAATLGPWRNDYQTGKTTLTMATIDTVVTENLDLLTRVDTYTKAIDNGRDAVTKVMQYDDYVNTDTAGTFTGETTPPTINYTDVDTGSWVDVSSRGMTSDSDHATEVLDAHKTTIKITEKTENVQVKSGAMKAGVIAGLVGAVLIVVVICTAWKLCCYKFFDTKQKVVPADFRSDANDLKDDPAKIL